jgi:hypothetical protein
VKYYHQQHLKKDPYGYCPDHGTGVSCPIGLGVIYGTGVKADSAESGSGAQRAAVRARCVGVHAAGGCHAPMGSPLS